MQDIQRLGAFKRRRVRRADGFASTSQSLSAIAISALALMVGIAAAAEHRFPDAHGSRTMTVIDSGLLSPGEVTISQGESVEFANYSSEAIELVFIEPKDRADDVRCQLTGKSDARGGSELTGLFPLSANGSTHHPTVTIPPGRYTTSCSFTPGQYAFVTKRVGRDVRSSVDGLGQKGTITVE